MCRATSGGKSAVDVADGTPHRSLLPEERRNHPNLDSDTEAVRLLMVVPGGPEGAAAALGWRRVPEPIADRVIVAAW